MCPESSPVLCQHTSKLDIHFLLSQEGPFQVDLIPQRAGRASKAFMDKRSSENPRASWGIGTRVLDTWATPGPDAGLRSMSQSCPGPLLLQHQAG